jgi:hypothetical protein
MRQTHRSNKHRPATGGRNNVASTAKTIVQMAKNFFVKAASPKSGTEADNGIGTPLPLSPDDGDDDDNN